jgi:hypothetical protein
VTLGPRNPPLYFAYGSNLATARLTARVPSARVLGRATLAGQRFAANKRGADGTAKANLEVARQGLVWGVVYELGAGGFGLLDPHEGGYLRATFAVAIEGLGTRCAQAYFSRAVDEALEMEARYREAILAGAREHRLPDAWIRMLEALPASG